MGARTDCAEAERQPVKESLKRFGEWIGRFVVQVHLGPRFGAFGARVFGADPMEDWEKAKIEAEQLNRKQALEADDPEGSGTN
jgi:hypothetical protein